MAIAILLRDLRKSNPNIQVAEVSNFPGYAVDSDGGVWTCRRLGKNGGSPRMTNHWRKVTQRDDKDGYQIVSLRRNNRSFTRMVHKLVLSAFVPKPTGTECSHYPDRDPKNNRLSNLRWENHRTNIYHKIEHGTHQTGEANVFHKLKECDVQKIRALAAQKKTVTAIASSFGISITQARRIIRRERWAYLPPSSDELDAIDLTIKSLESRLSKLKSVRDLVSQTEKARTE
jgi:hypothetical protein